MINHALLSERDVAILKLLDRTPATTQLLLKASVAFPGDPFRDERRVRERLRTLTALHFIRSFPVTQPVGGPVNWHKLTPDGFLYLHGEVPMPHRSRFEGIAPSRFEHTWMLAEVIVHTLVACHEARVAVTFFYGDGEMTVEVGEHRQHPDCFFQFTQSQKRFNVLFEIDNSTESVDSRAEQSVRRKILGYEAYQDALWLGWKQRNDGSPRPYFRVAFLTRSPERGNHILWLAGECARNPDRHLCYATTQDTYLSTPDAVRSQIFNDHHGRWKSLVALQPTAQSLLSPIRLLRPLAPFSDV